MSSLGQSYLIKFPSSKMGNHEEKTKLVEKSFPMSYSALAVKKTDPKEDNSINEYPNTNEISSISSKIGFMQKKQLSFHSKFQITTNPEEKDSKSRVTTPSVAKPSPSNPNELEKLSRKIEILEEENSYLLQTNNYSEKMKEENEALKKKVEDYSKKLDDRVQTLDTLSNERTFSKGDNEARVCKTRPSKKDQSSSSSKMNELISDNQRLSFLVKDLSEKYNGVLKDLKETETRKKSLEKKFNDAKKEKNEIQEKINSFLIIKMNSEGRGDISLEEIYSQLNEFFKSPDIIKTNFLQPPSSSSKKKSESSINSTSEDVYYTRNEIQKSSGGVFREKTLSEINQYGKNLVEKPGSVKNQRIKSSMKENCNVRKGNNVFGGINTDYMTNLKMYKKKCKFFTKVLLPLIVFFPLVLYILILPANYNKTFTIPRENVNPIKILRDEFAVPHIQASSLRDAFYALGFVQAQDRLWEMSFKKLLFSGRLSEFFGEKTLGVDKVMRNFLFARTAQTNYNNMPSEEKALIQAFADGVNDYVQSLTVLPFEFLVTGVQFDQWTPADSILMLKLMEFAMALKWNWQYLRHVLEDFYEREFIKEFTGCTEAYQYDRTYILSDEELKQSNLYEEKPNTGSKPKGKKQTSRKETSVKNESNVELKNQYLNEELRRMLDLLTEIGRGSNSWVISGKYTKSGKPILANDPHLDNEMPSPWYPVYIKYFKNGKERKVFGFSLAGSAIIGIGQNENVSWGITALLGDDSDIYKEELNPEGTHYKVDGKFYPLETFQEEIRVKGFEQPVLETFRMTKHGILLNKIFDFQLGRDTLGERGDFSLAWVGHLNNSYLVKTLLRVYEVSNVYEGKNAINSIETIYFSIIFADVEGNIGYTSTGLQKKKAIDVDDFFPLDGTESSNDWLEFLPTNESAFVINPRKGYIVTANNKFASDNLKHGSSKYGKPTGRAFRIDKIIREFISNGSKIGVEEIMRMQHDQIDEYSNILKALMIQIVRENLNLVLNQTNRDSLEGMLGILENWDGSMQGESKPAAVYSVWFLKWVERLFQKIKPQLLKKRVTNFYGFEQFLMRKLKEWAQKKNLDSEFCLNSENLSLGNEKNQCVFNLIHSLLEAKSYLEEKLGRNQNNWKWMYLHKSKYPHKPFSDTPLSIFFEKTIQRGGNMHTINVGYMKAMNEDFVSIHSANMRFISNLEKNEKSYFIIDTGMSESPLSPHFVDMMKLHHSGRYIEINENLREGESFYQTNLVVTEKIKENEL